MKRFIAFVLIIIMIMGFVTSCGTKSEDEGKPNSFFGRIYLNVLTDSMEPLINEGDLIAVKNVDPDSVKVGDVISFFDPASPTDAILTHRVIAIYEEGGVRYAITAGDNNANLDYERDRSVASKDVSDPDGKLAEVEAKATIMRDENKSDYEYVVYEGHRDSKPVALIEEKIIGIYTYTRIPKAGFFSKTFT